MNRHSPLRAALACAALIVAGSHTSLAAQMPGAAAAAASGHLVDRYPFVQADVDFLTGMIAHHNQATVMASWAPSHHANKSLQIYAGRVLMAQTAEIALMQDWLKDHGQVAPHPTMKDAMGGMASMSMPGMDMGPTLMPGMLTADQMKQLDKARGQEFDRLFLTFMIQHHSGAIQMVQTLFASPGAAQDDFMFKFANDVQADQTTEIDRMQQMLDAIPPEKGR
jgi:uncharacterized protein (DUF305 family)